MSGEATRHVCVKEVELALLQKTQNDTLEKVTDLVHLIRGNGFPGLVAEVREQRATCQRVQQDKKDAAARENGFWNRFIAPVYTVVAVGVLTLIISGLLVFVQNKAESSRVAKMDTLMQELERVKAGTK